MAQVNEPSSQLSRLRRDWKVIDALMGGTPSMRKTKDLLPQQPQESDEDYEYRLQTSTLFPAYERTSGVMAGKPFAKELVTTNVSASVEPYLGDINRKGSSLHAFAASAFTEYVAYGVCGIHVDFPRTDGENTTQAREREMGVRPFWMFYPHSSVLEVRYEADLLSRVRLLEHIEVDDGEWSTKTVQQVKVLEPGRGRIYRETGNSWELVDDWTTSLAFIPFVPFMANLRGEIGVPPLRDLAYLNIKHWQHQSDQDESARFARKRLLVFTGLESDYQLTMASDMALKLPHGATAAVVQGSAECITVGRSELQALEQQMIQTGAELLVAQPGQRTATEASNDAEANKSSLQRLVEDFEDGLDIALQYTADWIGAGEGGSVSLFKDFGAATLTDASAQLILSMEQGGLITKATALKEQQRRGVLSPDLDVETEAALAVESEPSLGLAGAE